MSDSQVLESSRRSRGGNGSAGPSTGASCGYGVLRISMFLMTVFFVLAAIVQLNDPDTMLWMLIYSLPAFLTFLPLLSVGFFDSSVWWLCVAAELGAHSAFTFLFISVAYESENLSWNLVYSEQSRESCGLVIVAVWLLFLLCIGSNKFRSCQLGNVWLMAGSILFAIFPFLCWAAYKTYWKMHCELPEHCTGIL